MTNYDVIVIGSGPGGYVSAIRCAQLGLKTAIVEGRDTLGGTCLNVGCIPSKALLHASHSYHEATHNFDKMGLIINNPKIDFDKMQNYKNDVISQNTKGIEFLLKKNKIDWLKGWAKIVNKNQVTVGENTHDTKNIIIASGSEPSTIPNVEIDENRIVSSTGALSLSKIPKSMIVIGAGVIGLEMGSIYSRLGTDVTVIEYMDHITPGMDLEISKNFQRTLKKQGLKFIMGAAVKSANSTKTKANVIYKKADAEIKIDAEIVLVSTGRKPFTNGLNFLEIGGELTERGQIKTNNKWQTSVEGIYAIGDAIAGPMLAHKAEDEGMAVAEVIAGKHGHVNYDVIPGVIYTTPEVANVGKTEEELKDAGIDYKVGKFSFMGNGRAKAVFQGEGFVKLLADATTDRILGCHLIGPAAGDLIHEICVAMEFGASAQDIAMTCHAHPTFSEAMREAALACGDGAIHA
ncbi:MAG: dihydrolipoyl dehydrogenase [Rhodobacterales bacterium]|jgi:dihydrolipoamide dehydrogenase|nr:dihydrolipoyl dehydrogenase [Rhodobacterales bacterium]MBT4132842.1 dihydrolipoyl dehydrogenase [Rhodobacterales bacterium]MBT7559060.1 dihydrolipoyl dehydrogenase [Rhodobacterales bacterium]MDG1216800.1 dihydrolipoyl dehydrogenase [Amylibacter sp.]MDG1964502.1 dihydrolipoyl dehydrogenase [Amylibacter sp.]